MAVLWRRTGAGAVSAIVSRWRDARNLASLKRKAAYCCTRSECQRKIVLDGVRGLIDILFGQAATGHSQSRQKALRERCARDVVRGIKAELAARGAPYPGDIEVPPRGLRTGDDVRIEHAETIQTLAAPGPRPSSASPRPSQ